MTYTNPITFELLMRERLRERLHEAEHERVVRTARSAAHGIRRPFAVVATAAVAFSRIVIASI